MGESYGWTDNGRQVFDPLRLEQAAEEIRKNQKPADLQAQLLSNLIPEAAFGDIGGGPAAYARLSAAYKSMAAELEKVGIDMTDLASRTLAAAQLAHAVDPATQAAARHGRVPE
ncbi:hypothetical protein [Dactylosporangium sp. NPDC051541]|uniref:hypothetical protein n=1 Tax=Dactylosporangium sp. NPDC051541 TaxID=3363977 RepID=UPI00379CB3ED